jgi:hypothetical protein
MKDHSDNSSKTIQSDSLRVATTRLGSTANTQSSTSNSLNECIADPTVPTTDNSSSIVYTRPDNTSIVFPFTMTVTRKGLFKFFHVENFENASEEEVMFLAKLHFNMHANVKMLAREAGGKADRVAQAVISTMIRMSEEVS